MKILELPPQPLPVADQVGAIVLTIWACSITALMVVFLSLLREKHVQLFFWGKDKSILGQFRDITIAAILMTIWFLGTVTDRWMHYSLRVVPFGYVLFIPIMEPLRVLATVVFLWTTYKLIWSELEQYFTTPRAQGWWWLTAKIFILGVMLVSFFYVILNIISRVVWLEFFSLNIISDVLSKRNNFLVSMVVFFSAFSFLNVVAATSTIIIQSYIKHREVEWARIYLWLATTVLLARSLIEMISVLQLQSTTSSQGPNQLQMDVSYGLLTSLYLLAMYFQARKINGQFDPGHQDVKSVNSDIRSAIIGTLRFDTNDGRLQARPFTQILDDAQADIDRFLTMGPLSSRTLAMKPENKRQAALECIRDMRRNFGDLRPRGVEF
ncbi:hypothetical protein GQ53DRAFT_672824, partial [Thozetella sp. PMI_491]